MAKTKRDDMIKANISNINNTKITNNSFSCKFKTYFPNKFFQMQNEMKTSNTYIYIFNFIFHSYLAKCMYTPTGHQQKSHNIKSENFIHQGKTHYFLCFPMLIFVQFHDRSLHAKQKALTSVFP